MAFAPPSVKDAGSVGAAENHVHRPVLRMDVRGLHAKTIHG
jgi:hypothetical protein